MGDRFFYPRYQNQEGVAVVGGQAYTVNTFGASGIAVNNEFITRFTDVDIPVGATVVGAWIEYKVEVKDRTAAQSFTFSHHFEATSSGGSTVKQYGDPLRVGVHEEATRNWTQHIASQTYNWVTGSSVGFQTVEVPVTTPVTQAITNAGRHMALTFKLKVTAETGDFAMGTLHVSNPPALHIEFNLDNTLPDLALANENCNFAYAPGGGLPDFWYKNNVFGFYSDTTTYTTAASFASGTITAPFGGNVVRVTANDNNAQAIWHRPISEFYFGGGQWSNFSGYVYVPNGVPDVGIKSFDALATQPASTSIKGAWVRLSLPYLHSPDFRANLGFHTPSPMTAGQSFYIANVNWVRERRLMPYFDGNTADTATYHRTFSWGGGNTGRPSGGMPWVLLDNYPTATPLDPQPSASTQDKFKLYWTYNDPYGEPQSRYRIQVRKRVRR